MNSLPRAAARKKAFSKEDILALFKKGEIKFNFFIFFFKISGLRV